jgi:hypothetical protein
MSWSLFFPECHYCRLNWFEENSFSMIARSAAPELPRGDACHEKRVAIARWQGIKKAAEAAF